MDTAERPPAPARPVRAEARREKNSRNAFRSKTCCTMQGGDNQHQGPRIIQNVGVLGMVRGLVAQRQSEKKIKKAHREVKIYYGNGLKEVFRGRNSQSITALHSGKAYQNK